MWLSLETKVLDSRSCLASGLSGGFGHQASSLPYILALLLSGRSAAALEGWVWRTHSLGGRLLSALCLTPLFTSQEDITSSYVIV